MRTVAAAALLLVLALPATAGARELRVDVPRTITATRTIAVTWSGDTGPAGADFGGFIVRAFLVPGRRAAACPSPAAVLRGDPRRVELAGQNVRVPGPLRGARRTHVPRAGRYRLCGYLTRAADRIVYERLVNRPVTVRRAPSRPRIRIDRATSGTYVARASAIAGGAPRSALKIVVRGRRVTAVEATGLRLSTCSDGIAPSHPLLNTLVDVASTGPLGPRSTDIAATSIAASLLGPPPEGAVTVDGGFASAREIRGVVVGTTAAGVCSGGFAFTARR